MKRSAHIRAAEKGVERRRLLTEDALREIVYAVRSGFAEAVREQAERQLAHDVADRYAQTIKISQARFKAGDISEAELRKIELEGLRYQNAVIDAEMQLDVARSRLAALLGLAGGRAAGRRWPSADADAARASRLRPAAADGAGAGAAPRSARRGRGARPGRRAGRVGASATRCPTSRWARPTRTATSRRRATTRTRSACRCRCRCRCSIATRPTSAGRGWISAAPTTTASGCASRSRATSPRRCAAGRARRRCWRCSSARPGGDVPGTPTGTSDKGGMLVARRDGAARRREVVPGGRDLADRAARGAAHVPRHAGAVPARALRLPPGSRRRLTRRRRAMTVSPRIAIVSRRRRGGAVRASPPAAPRATARPKRAAQGEKPRDFIRYDPNHAPHDFIKIETVQEASGATSISLPGRVELRRGPHAAGGVADRRARGRDPGQGRAIACARGQPLVQLSSPNVGQIQADAQKALSDLAVSEKATERVHKLQAEGAVAEKEVAQVGGRAAQGALRLRARDGAAEVAGRVAVGSGGERRAARADRGRRRRAQRAGRAGGARRSGDAAADDLQPGHRCGCWPTPTSRIWAWSRRATR